MMSRMLIAALAASVLFSSPVRAAAEQQGFTRDGVTYSYTVEPKSGGQMIVGTSSDNSNYRLFVKAGRVSGLVNGQNVSFRAADAEQAALVRVAAR